MKKLFLIIGILIFAMGILWLGQGLGYIRWPSTSFMLSNHKWAYYGGGLAIVGLAFMWFSRR